jgi:hypothetical protein
MKPSNFIFAFFMLLAASNGLFAQSISVSTTTVHPTCHNGNNGKVILDISGGSSPYSVNGVALSTSSFLVINLIGGTYEYTVTDTDNNQIEVSVTLINPQPLVVNALLRHVTVYNGNNGLIDLTLNEDATYLWTSANGHPVVVPDQDQHNLRAGKYSVKITSLETGCIEKRTYEIFQPNGLLFESSYDPIETSFAGNTESNGMIIYPNPSNGLVHLKADKNLIETTVINDMGIVVYKNTNTSEGSIEKLNLEPGMYTVISTNENGMTTSQRMSIR